MSTTKTPTIFEALANVMADVKAVGKNENAGSGNYGFKFRGIDAVINAVNPALKKHGVIVMPEVQSVEHEVVTANGKQHKSVFVTVKYTFYGPGGDSLSTVVAAEAMDSGDKGTTKAMSVAMRVALIQTLCLPTDEPDPDTQIYQREYPEPSYDFSSPDEARSAWMKHKKAGAPKEYLDKIAAAGKNLSTPMDNVKGGE